MKQQRFTWSYIIIVFLRTFLITISSVRNINIGKEKLQAYNVSERVHQKAKSIFVCSYNLGNVN